MASIETVVKVSITRSAQQVPLEAFNVPMVFGPSNRFSDVLRYYSDAADMISDGFLLSDPEYIAVAGIFSQANPPSTVGVSKYTTPTDQVSTLAVSTLVASGHTYQFTLNGTAIAYTSASDTQQSILSGLLAAISTAFPSANPVTGAVSGSGSSALLTLTAASPGVGFTIGAVDTDLTLATPTASHSIVSDIQATQAVDDTWYAVLCTSKATSDILQIAAYVQTIKKVYIASSSDANILTASTTDVGSQLKALGYTRTSLLYQGNAAAQGDAAWVGAELATTPGAGNWKFKNLIGQVADKLTTTQINFATAKHVNVYTTVGGIDITAPGVCGSGEYLDVIIFIDWIVATMEVAVYQVLANANKIAYTDAGIAAIENPVRQTLQIGVQNGGLAPGWTVTVPKVANVSQADKGTRTLNGVSFNATLAGAINIVNIAGFVGI